jgi:hypothetical protein
MKWIKDNYNQLPKSDEYYDWKKDQFGLKKD